MTRAVKTYRVLDVVRRRYGVGDLVMTTKHSRFGPGLMGPVVRITPVHTTIAVNLANLDEVTVRHYHVMLKERRTGFTAWLKSKSTRRFA